MLDASLAPGVVKPGFVAGVELSAGVLTGDGALGAGVSPPPNENPDFAAGVVELVVSFEAVASPKLNPPAGAGAVAVVAGFGAAAPPNENPPY